MLFNSLTYLVFLVLCTGCYWVLPSKPRYVFTFLVSCLFYAFWRLDFLFLMLFSAWVDYAASILISHTADKRKRRFYLLSSLCVNLGLLGYFKYTCFLAQNVWAGLAWLGFVQGDVPPAFNIILPLGISFYTFQTISYTIDVYRGFIKPETNFFLYGCYVTYFPQLVAGPILRAKEVIGQLATRPPFGLGFIAEGVPRILYGLFLKTFLADHIGPYVDDGFFSDPHLLSAMDVLTLAFLFGAQIYFDFAGYSHIAIGSALLMGVRLPENFNFPYFALSPKDFWKKWHISLSSWIRDYLYLPLAGLKVHDESEGGIAESFDKRQNEERNRTVALVLTWAIMGLWHGASWTFVWWGLWHAALVLFYRQTTTVTERLPRKVRQSALFAVAGWGLTLLLCMLGWILFRAENMKNACLMYQHLWEPASYAKLTLHPNAYIVCFLIYLAMAAVFLFKKYGLLRLKMSRPGLYACGECLVYSVLIFVVFVYLRPVQQFIYFQF